MASGTSGPAEYADVQRIAGWLDWRHQQSDEAFERWCGRQWQTHPHARLNMALDCTLPRDLLGEVEDGLAEVRYELQRRRRDAELDVASEKPTGPANLQRAEAALAVLEAYALRVAEGRLAAIVVDCWTAMGAASSELRIWPGREGDEFLPGPLAREEARQTGELQRRSFGDRVRERLADDPVLAAVLERHGADGVYAYAELTQHEVEVVWLEHRGVAPATIAEMTGRSLSLVAALLRKARWRLQQLGSGSAVEATLAMAG